ncbi:MAG: hypothetical protein WCB49_04805, partial [Gammaproteobacteria bacterium]
PSVTLTTKPAVFRGRIIPQPTAECSVGVPRAGHGHAPVNGVPIDATAGDWRVRLVARQLWHPRHRAGGSPGDGGWEDGSTSVVAPPAQGRWQPRSELGWLLASWP